MTLTRFWVWLQFLVSDLGLDASCVTDSPEVSDAWCVGYTGYCCKIYLRLTLQLPPSRPGPNLWRMSKLFWDKLFKSFRVGPRFSPLSLGTLILVLVGNGAMAQAVLSLNTKGNFFSVNFGWVSLKNDCLCSPSSILGHKKVVCLFIPTSSWSLVRRAARNLNNQERRKHSEQKQIPKFHKSWKSVYFTGALHWRGESEYK